MQLLKQLINNWNGMTPWTFIKATEYIQYDVIFANKNKLYILIGTQTYK